MSLRGRITLIILTCFATLAGVLLVEGYRREAAVQSRLEATRLLMLEASWVGLSSAERQRLLGHFEVIRRTPEALTSFATHSDTNLIRATTGLRSDVRPTHFQALRPDGRPFYDTRGGAMPAILTIDTVAKIAAGTDPLAGLLRTPDNDLVYALAAPVFATSGVAGVAVLWTDVPHMLTDLSAAVRMPTLMLQDGTVLQAQSQTITPPALAALPSAQDLVDQVTYLSQDDRAIQVAAIGLSDIAHQGPLTLVTLNDVTKALLRRNALHLISYMALGSAMILFAALLNWSLRTSFQPLNAVIQSLDGLTQGRTDLHVPPTARRDEIGRLAGTFETFRQGMEARTRLGRLTQELDVAQRIQSQCLPRTFPSHPGVQFAATMKPMREVGGDFYDVFDLPDGRVGFVIADVSDKGVGAALFMAIARTAVRSTAMSANSPADCVARVNDYLCTDNDAMLFVTLIYGILTPATGTVEICNAGHNPPVLIGPEGHARIITTKPQVALGILDGEAYTSQTLTLPAGGQVFLYTDGVTEAMTADGQEFGDDRLIETLRAADNTCADATVARVLEAVAGFVGEHEAHDDITCLTIVRQA